MEKKGEEEEKEAQDNAPGSSRRTMEEEGSDKGQDILAVLPRHQHGPHTVVSTSLGRRAQPSTSPAQGKFDGGKFTVEEEKPTYSFIFNPRFLLILALRGSARANPSCHSAAALCTGRHQGETLQTTSHVVFVLVNKQYQALFLK